MRQCCLAGSCLLPSARRALFTEVRLFSGTSPSNNLEKMLECYTQRPYAQYARYLIVKHRSNQASEPRAVNPQLLQLITLLSTCQPRVNPPITPALPVPRISKISSLYISGVSGSTLDFARILRAFPQLTKLKCEIKDLRPRSLHLLDVFLSKAPPPPPLQYLQLGLSDFRELDSHVLFPTGTNVHLRSLTINHHVDMAVWNTILQRNGDKLEELTVQGSRRGATHGECQTLSSEQAGHIHCYQRYLTSARTHICDLCSWTRRIGRAKRW